MKLYLFMCRIVACNGFREAIENGKKLFENLFFILTFAARKNNMRLDLMFIRTASQARDGHIAQGSDATVIRSTSERARVLSDQHYGLRSGP